MLVLLSGVAFASAPNVASNLGLVPVAGYDHTVFGVVGFVVPTGYAIFGLGMFDLRPVARDNLVEEVDDALFALDDGRRIVDYNAAAAALFADADDPVGRSLSALRPAVADALTLPAAGETTTTEIITVEAGNEPTHYSGHVTAITERGSVAGYSVVLRDVTEQEEYRRELERRNEQLDAFASAVAHDIRSPLQVADGYAAQLDDADPEAVGGIRSALNRMDNIVTDLRTLAEQGTGTADTQSVAFAPVVDEVVETVDTEGATVEVATGGTIEADRSRLRSVVENLVRNAVHHGGRAARGDGGDPGDEAGVTVRLGLTEDGFYVADDGPGVPPDERDAVFEYGYTDSEAGTGLGLGIVDSMASAHGWSIEVRESDLGGARFEISGATADPAVD